MMTYIIIAITVLVSISAFNNQSLMHRFQYNPYQVYHQKQYYRIFSHALIHADWNHLIFNMLTLFFFGAYVESAFKSLYGMVGILYFILLYVSAILISSLRTLKKHQNDSWYNAVGASGAVSAVLFSFILFQPLGKIFIFFIPIGIPAIVFGVAYLVYSAYMAKQNVDNIGHDAHFWGAVYGFIFPLFFDFRLIIYFLSEIFPFIN
ncbi:MAG TPA: rhomboid family intramembrane serine protease [Bacteroidales bacterium]|nr:rhomboid family intramembrane serine protease [Bacteroidales bacterium]